MNGEQVASSLLLGSSAGWTRVNLEPDQARAATRTVPLGEANG
jgi:hypothetical protein